MFHKPIARMLYAHIPGLAAARYAAKDFSSSYIHKSDYYATDLTKLGIGLIIDIGAHRGHSIAAFRRLSPAASVIAFEPDPRAGKRLVARYRHDSKVSIWPIALGSTDSTVTFYMPSYGHWDCDGMAATSYEEATDWLRDRGRMLFFNKKKLRVEEHKVKVKPLDTFSLSPSLIKLHAQGAELDILIGAHQTITQHRPTLMCAFPAPSVDRLLKKWGYSPGQTGDTFTWYS